MRKPWMRAALLALTLFVMPGQALAAKIVIDAGHGGSDPGAIGVNGLEEKTVNLNIALKLREILNKDGYETVITRDSDVYLSLQERVDFTNAQHADLFVSVHANSYSNPNTRGAMVLYYDDAYPQSSYPASDAMKALTLQSRDLGQKVLNAFLEKTGVENKGLIPSAVYVVRMGTIPSILVETSFLSNGADAAMLADDAVRQTMAQGIASGIEAYLPPPLLPDTVGHWARAAILRLNAQGIVEGVGARFEPNRALTRAEWMTLLDRVFHLSELPPTGSRCAGGATSGDIGGNVSAATSGATSGNASEAAGNGAISRAAGSAASGAVGGAMSIAAGGAAGGGTSGAASGQATPGAKGGGCEIAAAGAGAFKDVNARHWAFTALDRAVKAGVLEGYPDGTLRPDQPVTRAEVAAVFQRLAKPSAAAALSAAQGAAQPFGDVPADSWAAGAILILKEAGLIDGIKPGLFGPGRLMTRAEAAVLLDRYMTRK